MSKNPSNGNVKVGWILDSALPLKQFPLPATIIGSALDLTAAIAWQDYEIGASDSGDLDDRSLLDLGNAVSRGAASYGATLSMFRDKFNKDLSSIYVQAFEAFRVERTLGWLIVRVNKDARLPWAAGDEVSLYKVIADTVADDTEGEDSTKFTVSFLPQGALFVHTMLGGAGAISGLPTTAAVTVAGLPLQLQPVLSGKSIVSRATYTSANPAIATVSKGGTIKGLTAGTTTVNVSYGAATAAVPVPVTVTVGP